ncbi:MAG: hypothetical protein SangKO_055720 [Sandaracinaceae bacterium]
MTAVRALLVALLVLGGCDEPDAEPTPSPEAEEVAASPAAEEEGAPAEVEPTGRPTPPPVATTQRTRRLVREGRAAARAGENERAIERFRAAVALAPRDPRLHCELGYLLTDADAVAAERHLDRGLSLYGDTSRLPPRLVEPAAMCLYNMGRLLERQEDASEAEPYYEESLELRDSAVVRERLRAVSGVERRPGEGFPVDSVDALVERLAAPRDCTDEECRFTGECDECVSPVDVLNRVPGSGDVPEAAWLSQSYVTAPTEEVSYLLAVRRAEGFAVFFVLEHIEDNTDHGHSGEGQLRGGEATRLENGWLLFRYEERFEEGSEMLLDPPEGETGPDCFASFSSVGVGYGGALCREGDGALRCARVDLGGRGESRQDVWCRSFETEEEVPPPTWAGESAARESSTRLEVQVRGPRVRLHVTEGEPDPDRHEAPLDRWMRADAFFETLDALYAR